MRGGASAPARPKAGADRGKPDVRTSTTDIESGLVDLSRFGLQEAMTLCDPLVVESQSVLLKSLMEEAGGQDAGGPGGSTYFLSACDTRHG